MTAELKLCPWCGKPPKVCPDTSYGAATVYCPDENECPVGPVADADLKAGETLETAIERWNIRTPAADAGEVRASIDAITDAALVPPGFAQTCQQRAMTQVTIADAILSLLASPVQVTDREEIAAKWRIQGQNEGFAAAIGWLRDRSAKKPPAVLHQVAATLADWMERSRIPADGSKK